LSQRVVLKDRRDVTQRESTAGAVFVRDAEETDLHDLADGPDQEHRERDEDDGEDDRVTQTSHIRLLPARHAEVLRSISPRG
jgi:hypothetical protein